MLLLESDVLLKLSLESGQRMVRLSYGGRMQDDSRVGSHRNHRDHSGPAAVRVVDGRCPRQHRRAQLFVEFADAIVIDSFWISIFTAVLLKLLLDAVIGFEHRVAAFFRAKEGIVNTALGLVSVFAILFLSKFFILESVNWVFGDHVELGHFVEIVVLIVTMILVRSVMQVAYDRLGQSAP